MEIESCFNSLEAQLVQAINENLQNYLFPNASFLAERLVAERDCEEHRNLLADCYLAENKPNKAFNVLKECKSDMSRYKFAMSCIRINKLKEGEKALTSSQNILRSNQLGNRGDASIPNGCYGHYLLGTIYERQQKYQEAKNHFMKALDINPTLWVAYEKLVKMGEDIIPQKVFINNKFKGSMIYGKKPDERVDAEHISDNPKKTRLGQQQAITLSNSKRRQTVQKENIVSFLKKFADPTYELAMYHCEEAIAKYKELPQNHYATGWVLFQIGKAYMELVRYKEAQKYFIEAHKIQPYRLEGFEYYSSCLWHLKKYSDLVYLAHEACERSIYAYETWITMGNCFSGFKQHDLALKFFSRAIQLNPYSSVAYSLCAHEHVYNEDFVKAKKMFEMALAWDLRHYSAWWGLGNIAYKQEKYSKATQSFQKAASINPKNPVLYSFLGMTAAAGNDYAQALQFFYKSQQLDPNNCLNKYQKANALVKLNRYSQAIRELEGLHQSMPKEAPVLTLLGMIYKKMGKIDIAHNYLSKALDLECKDTQRIKGFIENLQSHDDDMEIGLLA